MGWANFKINGLVHIMPLEDLFGHELSEKCFCSPIFLYPDLIYRHNSHDKREYFENPPKRKDIVN